MHLAIQLIGSFGIFLLLLAAGMAVPFAIAIPGVLYLLMQNGVTALKGIGLVTWGSMNSVTLTAIPLFVLMAEMMQRSGLSFRIYRGLAKLVARLRQDRLVVIQSVAVALAKNGLVGRCMLLGGCNRSADG